jgi:hypothetical protein
MASEQKYTEGTSIVAAFNAAIEVMELTDAEQQQFFEKAILIQFDDVETYYGVSVDCNDRQVFYEIYLIKDFNEDDEPIYHLVEVNQISVDEYLDLVTEKKAI